MYELYLQIEGSFKTWDAADANAIEEVNLAYENVKEADCLDISKEGTDLWDAAVQRYEDRIDRVETRITAHLRDQLGTLQKLYSHSLSIRFNFCPSMVLSKNGLIKL